jgi:hypothetical protein
MAVDQIPNLGAVKISTEEVDVVNASRGGLLIESGLRLPPGTENAVELSLAETPRRVRGRILRCEVKALSPAGPRYQIAIAFTTPVHEIPADIDSPPPAAPDSPECSSPFAVEGIAPVLPDPDLAANDW